MLLLVEPLGVETEPLALPVVPDALPLTLPEALTEPLGVVVALVVSVEDALEEAEGAGVTAAVEAGGVVVVVLEAVELPGRSQPAAAAASARMATAGISFFM